ncbi:hypothetical protein VTI74DRAFT_8238 [Chaetomium olivicolor]
MATAPVQSTPRRRAGSLAEQYPGDRSHRPLGITQDHRAMEGGGSTGLPRRGGSLRERYPGDMSHRPLAMLERQHRAADRAPHLHNRHRQQPSDTIDSLDHSGPLPGVTYHHEGPYDATMKERNINKKYAPVEAVKDTNMEALKATPVEFVKDSLQKHVPLQGTAIIPPGMKDLSGRTMEYEEGADLMREEDAPGGAYKRWDHVRYRDDDLKGKGEPAFSYDQAHREKARSKQDSASTQVYYEMQPFSPSRDNRSSVKGKKETHVRQRSVSSGDQLQSSFEEAGSSGLQRSNTTGKNLASSLKRRFGSLKKKKTAGEEAGY